MTLRSRLPLILSIAASNFLVVLITLFEGASLEHVARVFWFQSFVMFVQTLGRVLTAEAALARKAISFAMFFLFNGLFVAGQFFLFFVWFGTEEPPFWTVSYIAACSALFLVNSAYLFKRARETGRNRKLVDDAEVLGFWARIQAVAIPCALILSAKRNYNLDYTETELVVVLLIIAVVDSAMQIFRAEEVEKGPA